GVVFGAEGGGDAATMERRVRGTRIGPRGVRRKDHPHEGDEERDRGAANAQPFHLFPSGLSDPEMSRFPLSLPASRRWPNRFQPAQRRWPKRRRPETNDPPDAVPSPTGRNFGAPVAPDLAAPAAML